MLSLRFWLGPALVGVLALTHGCVYRAAMQTERDKNTAARTVQELADEQAAHRKEQAARKKEQELQTQVRKVTDDLQVEKKRRAADAALAAGKLSDLKAALGSVAASDPPSTSGADDPRGAIINQCADALVGLDSYAQGLAATTRALQAYTRQVCVN